MNTTQEHVAKLFKSKGIDASNLWLEGERLRQAGFTVGHEYAQVWFKDRLVLTVASVIAPQSDAVKTVRRKVQTSDNGVPLIRIEGVQVQRTFNGFDTVKCAYHEGWIEIIGHKEEACSPTHNKPKSDGIEKNSKNSSLENNGVQATSSVSEKVVA